MKAEFELSLDNDGRPCISFKHHNRNKSLDQKVLKTFIDGVKKEGLRLANPTGYICSSEGESWEFYEIRIG